MLLDDCQQLSTLAKSVTDLRSNVDELNNFKTRQAEIEQIVRELKPLAEALQAFKEKGIYGFTLLQEVENFLAQVIEVEKQFKTEHKWLLGAKKIKPLEDKSKSLRETIEKQLRQQWITYRNSHVPAISNDFLSVLAKIPTFSQTVTAVRSLSSQIQVIDYPKDRDQFDKVEKAISKLTTAWSSVNSDEVPPEVLKFLKEAATINGAPMHLLNPTVQKWLDDKGIGSSFRIRLG
jgi:metal-dependent amidase/aminoacylase/carboxypeptidase family protein